MGRYLIGATNELAVRHIPNVEPRNDSTGGQPQGRRSDQVGGIFIVHKDDMKTYMHDWLSITEDVRFDPEVWWLPMLYVVNALFACFLHAHKRVLHGGQL